jgi:hypothetical protein
MRSLRSVCVCVARACVRLFLCVCRYAPTFIYRTTWFSLNWNLCAWSHPKLRSFSFPTISNTTSNARPCEVGAMLTPHIFLIGVVGSGVQLGPLGTATTSGILCQLRVIMMMEKLVEWLAGETEVLGENLPQCRFVHHKPHMLPGREPGPPL